MNRIKGILYAAVSSATFGLAPFFSISLLAIGYSSFEVLTYRWGVATVVLLVFAFLTKCDFHIGYKDFKTIFGLSLLRALTSFSLVIAYQNIASGVASIIHFMYPLAVAVTMAVFFREKKSIVTFAAIVLSLVGASLLSSGNIEYNGGNRMMGLIAACISVFSYAGYIIGIRKTRAVEVNSTVLTCYVMGLGALFFLLGGLFYDEGVRLETNVITWLYIGGLALPATAISNITLVKAVKLAGPTCDFLIGCIGTSYGSPGRGICIQRTLYYIQCFGHNPCCDFCKLGSFSAKENIYIDVCYSAFRLFTGLVRALR